MRVLNPKKIDFKAHYDSYTNRGDLFLVQGFGLKLKFETTKPRSTNNNLKQAYQDSYAANGDLFPISGLI